MNTVTAYSVAIASNPRNTDARADKSVEKSPNGAKNAAKIKAGVKTKRTKRAVRKTALMKWFARTPKKMAARMNSDSAVAREDQEQEKGPEWLDTDEDEGPKWLGIDEDEGPKGVRIDEDDNKEHGPMQRHSLLTRVALIIMAILLIAAVAIAWAAQASVLPAQKLWFNTAVVKLLPRFGDNNTIHAFAKPTATPPTPSTRTLQTIAWSEKAWAFLSEWHTRAKYNAHRVAKRISPKHTRKGMHRVVGLSKKAHVKLREMCMKEWRGE
ncbi:hypothetical protein EXIGLDRAFT_772095 [Exidia glandulosa HHB12029]|uniref:Uncharacterized protein n=1 Tax=Exidia glandulosa HHB12029 TaxID=1314781 RepID=A0A165FJ84_EXIGL|nr:hypothetical protein EXIGLDRAFT_772095 [Exidia glandulosa HHB12029]